MLLRVVKELYLRFHLFFLFLQSFWTANHQLVNATESIQGEFTACQKTSSVDLADGKFQLNDYSNMYNDPFYSENFNGAVPTNEKSSSSLAELLDNDNNFQETRFDFRRFESFQNLYMENAAPYQESSSSKISARNNSHTIDQERIARINSFHNISSMLPGHPDGGINSNCINTEVYHPDNLQIITRNPTTPYSVGNQNHHDNRYNNHHQLALSSASSNLQQQNVSYNISNHRLNQEEDLEPVKPVTALSNGNGRHRNYYFGMNEGNYQMNDDYQIHQGSSQQDRIDPVLSHYYSHSASDCNTESKQRQPHQLAYQLMSGRLQHSESRVMQQQLRHQYQLKPFWQDKENHPPR